MDIIARVTGIDRPDTSAFNDQIYLAEAEDTEGIQQNDAAIMHIMTMAFASPEMLSEMMLADMKKQARLTFNLAPSMSHTLM